jgi:hypothetical protein
MSVPEENPSSTLEARLTTIEQNLAALTADVAAMRDAMHAPSAASRPARPSPGPPLRAPPAPTSRGVPPRLTSRNIEALLGRYGMLAIAVVAAVAAVGTFLSWAISRGYLTLPPAGRVLVGLAFAALIAVWGFKLRRTERSFGSSMLGLALVIVQVCAFAAGPSFHLVPTWIAFAGAAAASWTLAIFAHADGDEPLWCVAFGGAALAPFVTSGGHGNLYALLTYGAVVLLPACFAISHRDWPIGWRVFYAISALFSVAGAAQAMGEGVAGFVSALAFPFVIALAGVVPFAPPSRKRGALRWLAALAVVASLAERTTADATAGWIVPSSMILAACVWLFIVDRHADVPQSSILSRGRAQPALLDWIDAAGISLFLTLQAVNVIGGPISAAAIFLVSALASLAFLWRRTVCPLRDAAAFASVVAAVGMIDVLHLEMPTGDIAAYLAAGLGTLVMLKLRPSRSWLATGGAVLLFAASISAMALAQRPSYRLTPFATEPSLSALLVTFALVVVARFWPWVRVATRASIVDRPEWTYAAWLRPVVRGVTLAPWVWAFVWVLIELSMAYSPSTSTLLLVTYFAATAVACVAVGRSRHSARTRQVGLALAIVAAATALYGATSYFDFATRIVAYLVTSAFLLGIAYWYRRPGSVPT